MECSLAVWINWAMALYEAGVGQHSYLEPEHLLIALLIFPDLTKPDLEHFVKNKETLHSVIEEQKKLKAFFRDYDFTLPEKSQKIQHLLREELGKGTCFDKNRKFHRSSVTKQIFKQAETFASNERLTEYSSIHLAQEILINPPPRVLAVLNRFDLKKTNEPKSFSYLQKYGKFLNFDYSASGLISAIEFDPILTVLHDTLMNSPDKNILLISASPRDVGNVMRDYINYIIYVKEVHPLVQVDINQQFPHQAEDPGFILNSVLEEVAKAGNIILFLNNFELWFDKKYTLLLEQRLHNKKIRCIAGINSAKYEELIKGKKPWNRLFHPIWIEA